MVDQAIDWRRDWARLGFAWLVLTALFWPAWALVPTFGLDPSWRLGISWAADLGLQWGPEVAFTYGPLGWLLQPMAMWWVQILVAAIVHAIAVGIALLAAYFMARTRLGSDRLPALLAASSLAGVALVLAPSLQVAVILGATSTLVSRSLRVLVIVGVALGVLGQAKLSDAVLALGFASLVALAARGPRGLIVLGVSTGLAWLATWVAAGQALPQVPDWLAAAVEVALTHSRVMSIETPGFEWHYVVAGLIIGLMLMAAWRAVDDMPRWTRVGVLGAVVWALWIAWKGSFARHDSGHVVIFVAVALVLASALVLLGGKRASAGLGVAAMLGALILYASSVGSFLLPLDRTSALESLGRSMRALASDEYRTQELVAARGRLRERYKIDAALQTHLADAPTMADPWDISAIWAADGRAWRPVPALQTYAAYSASLDRTSVDDLEAEPRQVLRSSPYPAIDQRNPAWESPLYQALIYCEYDERSHTDRWQILGPAQDPRCGEVHPDEAGPIDADAGELIAVPRRADQMTLVTIEPTRTVVDRLIAFVHKPAEIHVEYGGRQWRYAHWPRAERLMLNHPIPHTAFPDIALNPHALISVDHPVTYTFEFQDVDPSPRVSGEPADIADLLIRSAPIEPEAPVSPDFSNAFDVAVDSDAGPCIIVSATGGDPRLSMTVDPGTALWVRPDPGGIYQAFLLTAEGFLAAQSRRFESGPGAFELALDAPESGPAPVLRLDPPGQGTSTICQVRGSTAR